MAEALKRSPQPPSSGASASEGHDDTSLLYRLRIVEEVREDLQAGRDPLPRLREECDYWKRPKSDSGRDRSELLFLEGLVHTVVKSRRVSVG